MTNATFLPPPDGVVDGADLAFLLGAWGTCSESLMAGEPNPLADEDLGPMLEELIETSDADLAAKIAEMLEEMSGQ